MIFLKKKVLIIVIIIFFGLSLVFQLLSSFRSTQTKAICNLLLKVHTSRLPKSL